METAALLEDRVACRARHVKGTSRGSWTPKGAVSTTEAGLALCYILPSNLHYLAQFHRDSEFKIPQFWKSNNSVSPLLSKPALTKTSWQSLLWAAEHHLISSPYVFQRLPWLHRMTTGLHSAARPCRAAQNPESEWPEIPALQRRTHERKSVTGR